MKTKKCPKCGTQIYIVNNSKNGIVAMDVSDGNEHIDSRCNGIDPYPNLLICKRK